MTTVGTARFRRCTFDGFIRFFRLRVIDGKARLHIVQCEVQLIITDLLGRTAEVRAAQGTKDVGEALVLRLEAQVLTCKHGILGLGNEHHRLQGDDVVRQLVGRQVHARKIR